MPGKQPKLLMIFKQKMRKHHTFINNQEQSQNTFNDQKLMLRKLLGNDNLYSSSVLDSNAPEKTNENLYNFVFSPTLIVSPPILLLPKFGSFCRRLNP